MPDLNGFSPRHLPGKIIVSHEDKSCIPHTTRHSTHTYEIADGDVCIWVHGKLVPVHEVHEGLTDSKLEFALQSAKAYGWSHFYGVTGVATIAGDPLWD